MKPNWEAIDHAIEVLNRLLKADPKAAREFLLMETVVNTAALADDPEIQVLQDDPPNGPVYLRPLGLINGLFGADENSIGYISMDIDDSDGSIVGFRRVRPEDFQLVSPPAQE
jgi:hypothetical protein